MRTRRMNIGTLVRCHPVSVEPGGPSSENMSGERGGVIHEGDRSNEYGDLDLRNAVFERLVLQGHTSAIPTLPSNDCTGSGGPWEKVLI